MLCKPLFIVYGRVKAFKNLYVQPLFIVHGRVKAFKNLYALENKNGASQLEK